MTTTENEWLPVPEAAAAVQRHEATVYRWLKLPEEQTGIRRRRGSHGTLVDLHTVLDYEATIGATTAPERSAEPMTLTPTRTDIASAIEAEMAQLVTNIGTAIRGTDFGIPEPVVEHLATVSAAIVASTFGSDISEDSIRQARMDRSNALTALIAETLAPSLGPAKLSAWVIGASCQEPGGPTGFVMLTSSTPTFEHSSIAVELVDRVRYERHGR